MEAILRELRLNRGFSIWIVLIKYPILTKDDNEGVQCLDWQVLKSDKGEGLRNFR